MTNKEYFAHETAVIDDGCQIGKGSKIWHFSHLMSGCKLGEKCNIGQNVVVSPDVILGNNVKVQNNVSIYTGVICEDEVFLGRSVTQHKHVSDETALKIDMEIRSIIETAHKTATDLIQSNREKLEVMTDALMKYETIGTSQIDQIMEGKIPDPPEDWDDSGSNGGKKAEGSSSPDP